MGGQNVMCSHRYVQIFLGLILRCFYAFLGAEKLEQKQSN